MAFPDHLADLERKVAGRFSTALAELRQEMRRVVETQAQRASAAMLADLEAVRPAATAGLVAEEDLLAISRAAGSEGRRSLARSLHNALLEFDQARTQNAVLDALLDSSRAFGDHVALWLMRPTEVIGWASRGFVHEPVAGSKAQHSASPALRRLAGGRGCLCLAGDEARELAEALGIGTPERSALLPLVLRDRIAAALYIDAGEAGEFDLESLQLLTLAAAQRLELQALSNRSYTPTLYLDADAPSQSGGLALWDPTAPASAAPAMSLAALPAAVPPETPAVAAVEEETQSYSWQESAVAEEAPATAEEGFEFEAALPEVEPAPSVAAPESYAPAEDDIAWQLEESGETRLSSATAASANAETLFEESPAPLLSESDSIWAEPTPTHELPLARESRSSAPAVDPVSEWQEVEERTAPQPAFSPAATQRLSAQAATNEFPQPPLAPAAPTPSTAATIAFVPPAAVAADDLADDATIRIQRSALYPSPGAVPAAAPTPPVPIPAAAPIAPLAPIAPIATSPAHDDEPTLSRGPRTTEVAPPADLQGPGWAFSSGRTARTSGDNALHEEARRLARLLVSEIKLYNEDQVEEGRHNRDIYHRLKDDIDRSRQIYEERVHESVRGTTDYFQQELVRSLAGGDPRALGI